MDKMRPKLKIAASVAFAIAVLALFAYGASSRMSKPTRAASTNDSKMNPGTKMKIIQEIERYRQGDSFDGDVSVYSSSSAGAIDLLASELRQNPSSHVRLQLVDVLVAIACESDPAGMISDRQIVSILLNEGSTLADGAYMQALDRLAKKTSPSILGEFGKALAKLAKRSPDPSLFLVIAKAKAQEALPELEGLRDDPRWNDDECLEIALAALGDKPLENKFTKAFLASQEPSEKIELARKLGQIGSRSALRALAQEMRTPLIYEMPGNSESSVRVEIASAIGYNYPDKPFLMSVQEESDYERIEKFCESEFGIEWKTPRPPFLVFNLLPPG